jgi:3-oxoacyl-[acyl-carrier-protein] synthase-3
MGNRTPNEAATWQNDVAATREVVAMSSSENLDESRALELSRQCVASKLPFQALPGDDDDLVETGLLDSMGWVDVLIGIESATDIRDFGNTWPEGRAKSIRALADMIREARRRVPEEKPGESSAVGTEGGSEVSIGAWGYALGAVTVSADQIESECDVPPHKIRNGAGIRTLQVAADTEDELTLGQRAAEAALEMAEMPAERIDFLVATSTTFLNLPSFAPSLHSRLLLRETGGALDVGGACVGLIYSLAVAKGLLRMATQGVALVVASEVHSRRLNAPRVPGEFRGLFGDGACAFVLTRATDRGGHAAVRLGDFVWGCSATFASSLSAKWGENSRLTVQFKGEQLAHAAVTQMDRILEILENKSRRARTEVDYFAFHQPNPRVVEILAEKANIPLERIPLPSATGGNLGSATCGISLCQALTDLRTRPNPSQPPLIFMAAVGPGLIWGGAFLD